MEGLEIEKPNVLGVGREAEGSLGVTRPLGLTIRVGDLLPKGKGGHPGGTTEVYGSVVPMLPSPTRFRTEEGAERETTINAPRRSRQRGKARRARGGWYSHRGYAAWPYV